MSITKLIPLVQELPRAEKFQLLSFLVTDIGQKEGIAPLDQNALGMAAHSTYPIWTPIHVPEATVTTLAAMLEEDKRHREENGE